MGGGTSSQGWRKGTCDGPRGGWRAQGLGVRLGAGVGAGSKLTPRFLMQRRHKGRSECEMSCEEHEKLLLSVAFCFPFISFGQERRREFNAAFLSSATPAMHRRRWGGGRCEGEGRGISKHGADATSACSTESPSRRPSTCPVWDAQHHHVPGPGRSPQEPCPD